VAFGDMPNDCRICRQSEAHRAQWGCDRVVEGGTIDMECPECIGERRASCETCAGAEHGWRLMRCPRAIVPVKAMETLRSVLRVDVGILPMPGAWSDQPAWFRAAAQFVSCERESWRTKPE